MFHPCDVHLPLRVVIVNHLLKTVVDMAISPWSDLSSNSSHRSSECLKDDVLNYYDLRPNQCMVLGILSQGKVRTAHIWPRSKGNTMALFNLHNKVNSARNCLRLAESIEQEFDRLSLTIIQEDSKLKVR